MWTYRIIKEKDKLGDWYYSVREVIGKKSWTIDEVAPYGGTRDEMRKCVTDYINDISNLPILIVEEDKIIGREAPLSKLLKSETIRK
jgi:hypothetical protein